MFEYTVTAIRFADSMRFETRLADALNVMAADGWELTHHFINGEDFTMIMSRPKITTDESDRIEDEGAAQRDKLIQAVVSVWEPFYKTLRDSCPELPLDQVGAKASLETIDHMHMLKAMVGGAPEEPLKDGAGPHRPAGIAKPGDEDY